MGMRKNVVKNTLGVVGDCRISSKTVCSVGSGVSPFYARLPYPPQYTNPSDWQNTNREKPEYRALVNFIDDSEPENEGGKSMDEVNHLDFVVNIRLKDDNPSKRPCLHSYNHEPPQFKVTGYQLRAMLALIGKDSASEDLLNYCQSSRHVT